MGSEKSKMQKDLEKLSDELLKIAFVACDTDGNGLIDHNELQAIAIEKGLATKETFESAYAGYMKKYDKNKDGMLNVKEFIAFCKAEIL
jgi:Ca2+-binding EF-hand superfamily protein